MKRSAKALALTLLCVLALLLSSLSRGSVPVSAQEQSDVITAITAMLRDGSGPVGNVEQWQVFRLEAEFSLPNGQIKAGDTTTITLPEKLRFYQFASFEITDAEGHVVAVATIDGPSKTLTLTYTDYPENHSDVSGKFFFYVRIDRDKVDGAEDITLTYDVSGKPLEGGTIHFVGIPVPGGNHIGKSGYQTGSDRRSLHYQVTINTKGTDMEQVVITDQLTSPGITIVPGSFVINKGRWEPVHGDFHLKDHQNVTDQYTVELGEDLTSFRLVLGDIGAAEGFTIHYDAISSYDLADGEIIHNQANLNSTHLQEGPRDSRVTYLIAGGSAEGYVYGIEITKVDPQGNFLGGAVFQLVRLANDVVAGTLTTDSQGQAFLGGLLKDSYKLIEVQAPEGYQLSTEEILIDVGDFNADKIAYRTISNEPTPPETEPETEPETTEPETEPETTEPETEPETTVPETEPETTVPETEPETTVPETEPETTKPETEPETTVPETEPETTVPGTEPETTVPTTVPETTNPPTEPIRTTPKTGDSSQLPLWGGILVLAVAGVTCLLVLTAGSKKD